MREGRREGGERRKEWEGKEEKMSRIKYDPFLSLFIKL